MDFRQDLIAEYDRETAKTRKMMEAIPADADFNYKPHPKSMSLGRLAGHLTDMVGDVASSYEALPSGRARPSRSCSTRSVRTNRISVSAVPLY